MTPRTDDMSTGARFGRWTVEIPAFVADRGRTYVVARRECGNVSRVLATKLRRGDSRQCRRCQEIGARR